MMPFVRQARPMPVLQIETDAADAGFDADRLARIDRHFQGYVDQKKLAGWHIAISRAGKLVHSSIAGHRDIATGAPFTTSFADCTGKSVWTCRVLQPTAVRATSKNNARAACVRRNRERYMGET